MLKRLQSLASRAVIFREFNKAHAQLIARSFNLYFFVLAACVGAGYVFGFGAVTLLNVALAASVAAHVIRIYQIDKSASIVPTRAEKIGAIYITCVGVLMIAALYAIGFALTRPTPYWEFSGGLFLVSYCAMFADFLIAHAINSKS